MKRLLLLFPLMVACSQQTTHKKINPLDAHRSKFEIEEPTIHSAGSRQGLAAGSDATTLSEVPNWFTKSPEIDGVEGVRAELAYQKLELSEGKTVIVAVVDSGVDINHEDLKEKIWSNEGETGVDAEGNDKASNKIDDDKNGYVDDVHGWNFIGGHDTNGNNINIGPETLEVTRELVRYKKKKADLEAQGKELSPQDQAYLEKVEDAVETARKEAQDGKEEVESALVKMAAGYETLKDLLKIEIDAVTPAALKALENMSAQQQETRDEMLKVFQETGFTTVARMKVFQGIYNDELNFYYNEEFNPRKDIVKDSPDDFSDVTYGNNDVMGPDSDHGTHVSGIIAAVRGNQKGMDGIATNVKIMAVRTIPNGDERDKDVALSIRYAVDNGADIINMSFGKAYSPDWKEVSKAMQYAESHGVILVHAAGNSSANNDTEPNFPNRVSLNDDGIQIGEVSTWIEVGASTPSRAKDLPAPFSNFGIKSVDVFAPGFRINSTVPDNKYAVFSGTSMASPTVAGVVALTMSQRHEEFTPWEVRKQVINSHRSYEGLEVLLPGTTDVLKLFSHLSMSGGIVDVFNALTLTK